MIFDTAIITPAYALIGAGVFCTTGIALFLFLKFKPNSFLVPKHRNIYFAGIILALVVSVASFWQLSSSRMLIGFLLATIVIILIGRIDEKKNSSPGNQLGFQALIASIVIYFGWSIPHITNIFYGGVLILGPIGALLAFVWILACMNAVNFLDGTDGLAPAVIAIACLALAGISLLPATQDSTTFILAIIGFSAIMAFFLFNAPPARIYLGTTGSWFLGLFIALVAMIGGGKIVTTLIVLALPILDVLFVVVYRIISKKPIWRGDTISHIHHRLTRAGVGKWNIVLFVSAFTSILAIISVIATTQIKILAFCIVAVMFFITSARMMKHRTL
jgi:UDP-GlcNAc:undecaprenyl-phosphate GlcNAc-1-phosphate transferase